MPKTNRPQKLYYNIAEVAGMFGLSETVLRYWEKHIPELSPKRGNGGRTIRYYSADDVRTVRLLFHLIKERGMTIAGARQCLKDNRESLERQTEAIDRLRAIRDELAGMSQALKEYEGEEEES